MTGVNAIAYYATTIYTSSLHFPAVEASALAAASQACIILGGIICSVTVDRYGRRRLMIVSATAMSLCFACVTALVSQSENGAASKAAVFFLSVGLFTVHNAKSLTESIASYITLSTQ
jgi:MFS family permease